MPIYEHMSKSTYLIYRFNVVKYMCILEHMRDPSYVLYRSKALKHYSVKALMRYYVNTLML